MSGYLLDQKQYLPLRGFYDRGNRFDARRDESIEGRGQSLGFYADSVFPMRQLTRGGIERVAVRRDKAFDAVSCELTWCGRPWGDHDDFIQAWRPVGWGGSL